MKSSNFNKNPEILVNGSSMSGSGINSEDIQIKTGKSISRYIHEGISVFDRYEMINHFFSMYPQGVETVIYEINPVLLTGIKTSENVYIHFLPYMDDKNINKFIKKNASSKEYYIHKIIRTTRYDSRSILGMFRNHVGISGNVKKYGLDSLTIKNLLSVRSMDTIIINKSSKECFERTMDILSFYSTSVLLVMMPMHYSKLETYTSDSYSELCIYFDNYCSSKGNFQFLDLNQDSIIYNAGNFSDPLHANLYGQIKITEIISNYLIEGRGNYQNREHANNR